MNEYYTYHLDRILGQRRQRQEIQQDNIKFYKSSSESARKADSQYHSAYNYMDILSPCSPSVKSTSKYKHHLSTLYDSKLSTVPNIVQNRVPNTVPSTMSNTVPSTVPNTVQNTVPNTVQCLVQCLVQYST